MALKIKNSNLILTITVLAFHTGIALGSLKFANAAEFSCENMEKQSVATASASDFAYGNTKDDFSDEIIRDKKERALAAAKAKLANAAPTAADAPAACIGECEDGGIMPPELGEIKERIFESRIDTGKKCNGMTPEQEVRWMEDCIDEEVYARGETLRVAKLICEAELRNIKCKADVKPWIYKANASVSSVANFIRLCNNPQRKSPH